MMAWRGGGWPPDKDQICPNYTKPQGYLIQRAHASYRFQNLFEYSKMPGSFKQNCLTLG